MKAFTREEMAFYNYVYSQQSFSRGPGKRREETLCPFILPTGLQTASRVCYVFQVYRIDNYTILCPFGIKDKHLLA